MQNSRWWIGQELAPKLSLIIWKWKLRKLVIGKKKSKFFENEIITEIAGDEPAIAVSGEFFCNQFRYLEDCQGLIAVSTDKEIILEFTHETRRKLYRNFVF
jgi:hypothetical protein